MLPSLGGSTTERRRPENGGRGRNRTAHHELRYRLGREVTVCKQQGRGNARLWAPTDVPAPLSQMVLATCGNGLIPSITAVITAPIVFPDGRVLDEPGYDAASGLLYVSDSAAPRRVPAHPTPVDAVQAAVRLWQPYRMFPFVTAADRGVFLAALLTSVVRRSLDAAPAVLIEAPAAGSGKTLLAKCLAALTSHEPPATTAPTANDDEQRKRLFSLLRGGAAALIVDNLVDQLESAALCEFLTSNYTRDRVLGESRTLTLANSTLVVLTGNNVTVVGDLNRRVLRLRIDSGAEDPYRRPFDFDPLALVRDRRQDFAIDACTILRAYHVAGAPRMATNALGSFDKWNDTVRQAVLWLASEGLGVMPGEFDVADPALCIETGSAEDPEREKLRAVHAAWFDAFGDRPVSAGAACNTAEPTALGEGEDDVDDRAAAALHLALREVAPDKGGQVNRTALGKWIARQKGRVVDGLRFDRVEDKHSGQPKWAVRRAFAGVGGG